MSFDEIVAELPKLTGPELQQIAEKAEFLAGLDEGLRQIAEGKLIPHEEVKKEFRSWLIGSRRWCFPKPALLTTPSNDNRPTRSDITRAGGLSLLRSTDTRVPGNVARGPRAMPMRMTGPGRTA